MSYYMSRTLESGFDEAVSRTIEEFKHEGFGVLTEIDAKEKLKEKLGVEFRNYKILGMCNTPYAYRALQAEDKIGVMLPCSVVVQEAGKGRVEVAAIDPIAAMQAVGNPELEELAAEVTEKIRRAIERL
ncbi:MAG: DUF302 domain-containing protein [Actinobacteria bacterium]|nr:MAG: DUF302 domain-containing protein [Actinomycetota bacterium]